MTDDYCLHPDLCGIGQDCSECHQNHVQQLKAEVARLREFAEWCADLEAARDLWGSMSDLDWFVAIEEKAKEAVQESSDE